MEKDLALSGYQSQFVKTDAEGLLKELTQILIERDKLGQLNNVLYRVDVNPSTLIYDSYSTLAELIWNRELKKVMFRKLYSKDATIAKPDESIES